MNPRPARVPSIPRPEPDPLDEVERIMNMTDRERQKMIREIRDELAREGNRIDGVETK